MVARLAKSLLFSGAVIGCIFTSPLDALAKVRLVVLHSFAGGTDGATPWSTLIMGKKGELYGTTTAGGSANLGTVFEISKKGVETIIHSFTGGNDGANPYSGVALDANGNLYGTTYFGGSSGLGVVYKISPNGAEAILHTFQGIYNNTDGSYPFGGVSFGTDGNLYGTTVNGGSPYDNGTIYAIAPNGAYSVLYALAAEANSEEGAHPYSDVTEFTAFDATYLAATASSGGGFGFGAAFSIIPPDDYFADDDFANLESDGATPIAGIDVIDEGEQLMGVTSSGGYYGLGTVFSSASQPNGGSLYSFQGIGASDGSDPYAKLIPASDGYMYGTTVKGGNSSDSGTIYTYLQDKLDAETVVYRFSGSDGSYPYGAVLEGKPGTFYGTTSSGGANNLGVVYKLVVK
jgi:uncharacterized repeat protein (TIGR03803 family)